MTQILLLLRMRLDVCLILTVVLLQAGCVSTVAPPRPTSAPAQASDRPHNDVAEVGRSVRRMETAVWQLDSVARTAHAEDSRTLSPRALDAVEWFYSDFLSHRATLETISLRPESPSTRLAGVERIRCDALLIAAFLDDELMTRTLNQSFHRSTIPANRFDEILFEVTQPGVLPPEAAPSSETVALVSLPLTAIDPATRAGDEARGLIKQIIRRRSSVMPDLTNHLWHAPTTQALAGSKRAVTEQLRRGRSGLVERISRIKNPWARPLEFSELQKAQISSVLQPGDILLTYTSGVASNLFLPGKFKHALTYVGTPAERARVGFTSEWATAFPDPWRSQLLASMNRTALPTGEPANLVESLAEGVIFNNLERVLETRVNRLVVLRPRLRDDDRLAQLVDVFSFVGDEYDFTFDFADASDQVCTEVVYRSLQGRGGIDFTLPRRAGHETLSADDIIRYMLESPRAEFECVLFVDEDPQAAGRAHLVMFADARLQVARLMDGAALR